MRAVHLRAEYLHQPLPLDVKNPRFYWHCEGGVAQTAYQIIARRQGAVIWDSGKVESPAMAHIRYAGEELESRNWIDWSVRLWDEQDKPGEWAESWFELGLTAAADWQAKWITGAYKPKKNMRYPVDCFKRTFVLSGKLRRARLYITACGLYEAALNGSRVGDYQLAPGCTDYRSRLQYQAYDVTALLAGKNAENTLEIQLADGWYRGSIGCFAPTNVFGRQTKLLCQLELDYEDGRRELIVSDDGFSWCNDGPIRFADLKDGEIVDAGRTPSYSGQAVVTSHGVVPVAANNVQPMAKERFPARLLVTPSGKRVLDFGQNIAGFVSFRVKGQKGQLLKLRLGEILGEDGELTQKNFQLLKPAKEYTKITQIQAVTGNADKIKGEKVLTPLQEVTFTCSGREDHYTTRFAVFGFQFAEVESDIEIIPEDFEAVAVYSDMEQTGEFSCSNALLNRFYQNTVWSMKGNYLDVPTDCPTRERMGWTGDAQIFFNTAAYLMDVSAFMKKWLRDIRDGQFASGKSSAVIPYQGCSMVYDSTGVSAGFADAVVLIPYRYWKRYGDDDFLAEYYDVMRNFALYLIKHAGPRSEKANKDNPHRKYIYEKGMQLGEWLEPEDFRDKEIGPQVLHTEVGTAYLHYSMACMAEVARTLGKSDDEALYTEYAEGAKRAYNYLYLRNGTIDTDRQAKLVRPLALGLAQGEAEQNLQRRLVQAVENRDYKVGTGFLSTAFLLPMLSRAGRADVAYKMLESEQAPGWLAEVKAGATTVWEDWEGKASRNHYAPGAVCEWLFSTVGGIKVAGENHFAIQPVPGGSLAQAQVSYLSLYGRVCVQWERSGSGYRLTATIPANTCADITLPNGQTHAVCCGTHSFNFTMN